MTRQTQPENLLPENWDLLKSSEDPDVARLASETANLVETLRRRILYRIIFSVLGAYWIGVLLSTQSAILTMIFALTVLIMAIDVMTGLKAFGSVFGFGAVVNGFPNIELAKILGIGGPAQFPDLQVKKAVEEGWKLSLKTVIIPMSTIMVALGLILGLFAFLPPAWGKGVLYALIMPPFLAIVIGALVIATSGLDPKKEPVKARIRNAAYVAIALFTAVSFYGIYDGGREMTRVADAAEQGPVGTLKEMIWGYRVVYEVPSGTNVAYLPPLVLPKNMEPGLYEIGVEGDPRITLRYHDDGGNIREENYSLRGEQPNQYLPRRTYGGFGIVIGGVIPGETTFVADSLSIGLNISDAQTENFDRGTWEAALTPVVITLKKR